MVPFIHGTFVCLAGLLLQHPTAPPRAKAITPSDVGSGTPMMEIEPAAMTPGAKSATAGEFGPATLKRLVKGAAGNLITIGIESPGRANPDTSMATSNSLVGLGPSTRLPPLPVGIASTPIN